MSTPLPPDLAVLERALEASRAPLPPELKARVLSAASAAVPAPLERRLSRGWFAASVAIVATVLLNLSNSAALSWPEPQADFDKPVLQHAVAQVLHQAREQWKSP